MGKLKIPLWTAAIVERVSQMQFHFYDWWRRSAGVSYSAINDPSVLSTSYCYLLFENTSFSRRGNFILEDARYIVSTNGLEREKRRKRHVVFALYCRNKTYGRQTRGLS